MANRPNFIDIRSQPLGPLGTNLPSPSLRGLPSPRIHVAGEVPPELSPLDAFAAQSRLLAKQLDQTTNGGKRLSRLPPLTTANSFNQNRPSYFRSISAEAARDDVASPQSPSSALKTEVETPDFRPMSVHPHLSGMPAPIPPFASPRLDVRHEEEFRGRRPHSPANEPPFFGARREQSPAALERERGSLMAGNSLSNLQARPSAESTRHLGYHPRREQDGYMARGEYDSRALAPPRSPYAQITSSPRSKSDTLDDGSSSGVPISLPRTLSGSSGPSTSPISPFMPSMHRSPSITSEISIGGTRLARPAFNFSRPLSRASASGVSLDAPSRQASSDSQPSFVLEDDTANTPVSMHSEGFPDNDNAAAPSYVYSRFSLPRGKVLQRNSLIFQENMSQAQFSWEQPVAVSNVQTLQGGAPPSPPSRPSTSYAKPDTSHLSSDRPSPDPGRPSLDPGLPSPDPSGTSQERERPSTEHGKSSPRLNCSTERTDSPSAASSSTIKASPQPYLPPSIDCSADEHVSQAIEFHEKGDFTKSTYHLRLAARQNHPTGMLLYALACRHGWGMRANQREGVAWLRKAADSASLEIVGDELTSNGKSADPLEKNARKAEFALSIYELGVSHMNGWGIEQDKVLALRCFEIAGSWGDADALAEAGFCYAQGSGCKKDLKKSARFYRQAENKGISMVGNSWIYKAKYAEDTDDKKSIESKSLPEKKSRNKSRTRTMFGRSKATTY